MGDGVLSHGGVSERLHSAKAVIPRCRSPRAVESWRVFGVWLVSTESDRYAVSEAVGDCAGLKKAVIWLIRWLHALVQASQPLTTPC